MNEIGIAFELMGVGMITVFVILALVVVVGRLIILFVNRFIGPDIKSQIKTNGNLNVAIGSKKLAVIVSAVNLITKGTGRVTDIKKQ